eukprot:3888766-Rhodomonas_salina.8
MSFSPAANMGVSSVTVMASDGSTNASTPAVVGREMSSIHVWYHHTLCQHRTSKTAHRQIAEVT